VAQGPGPGPGVEPRAELPVAPSSITHAPPRSQPPPSLPPSPHADILVLEGEKLVALVPEPESGGCLAAGGISRAQEVMRGRGWRAGDYDDPRFRAAVAAACGVLFRIRAPAGVRVQAQAWHAVANVTAALRCARCPGLLPCAALRCFGCAAAGGGDSTRVADRKGEGEAAAAAFRHPQSQEVAEP
jgi:hypothetical protein